jgi:hypothetical protein
MTRTSHATTKIERDTCPLLGVSHALTANHSGRHPRLFVQLLLSATLATFFSVATSRAVDPDPAPPPNVPPFIDDFAATERLSEWTFEGRVLDENLLGLVVTFGGLLNGHQATVQDPDGYFYYTVSVQGPGTVRCPHGGQPPASLELRKLRRAVTKLGSRLADLHGCPVGSYSRTLS